MNHNATEARINSKERSCAGESFSFFPAVSGEAGSARPYFTASSSISAAHFFSLTVSRNRTKPNSITAHTAST